MTGRPGKTCGYCGMDIPMKARICPYCRKNLDYDANIIAIVGGIAAFIIYMIFFSGR